MPLLRMEAEIAFRFDRALPQRAAEHRQSGVAEAATALVAIEVVAPRFRSYKDAPFLDRTADGMSNSALVMGTVRPDWWTFGLEAVDAVLHVNGTETVRQPAGHVVTTGAFTGLALWWTDRPDALVQVG